MLKTRLYNKLNNIIEPIIQNTTSKNQQIIERYAPNYFIEDENHDLNHANITTFLIDSVAIESSLRITEALDTIPEK